MDIKLNISDKLISDLIVIALEGGSNYWYNTDFEDGQTVKKMFHLDDRQNMSKAELIAKAVLNKGFHMPIYDVDDDTEVLGYISRDNITRGLASMLESSSEAFGCMFGDDWDACTADIFLQYVVLNKIMYG